MAAGGRRPGIAHHPAGCEQSPSHLHRHFGSRRFPHRRRRQDLEADQSRAKVPVPSSTNARGRLLRSPHGHAPSPTGRALTCSCTRVEESFAAITLANCGRKSGGTCRRISASRLMCMRTAGNHIRHPNQSLSRALSARWQTARISQPQRRPGMGAVDQGPAARELLRQCAARGDGRRFARFVRRLFRHDRRSGIRLRRFRRQLDGNCPRSSGGSIR